MKIKVQKPNFKIVNALSYKGRLYTVNDLDQIFNDFEKTENILFNLQDDFKNLTNIN